MSNQSDNGSSDSTDKPKPLDRHNLSDLEETLVNTRPTQSVAPGDMIGERYVVDGQIARGGMGRIMRVRHIALDKAFALKVAHTKISANYEVRKRFYREARMASSLQHDNICTIVDFGDDPTFGLYMVMELLDGRTLTERLIKEKRFSAKRTADVILQIAEALQYVHSQGVIHGDIKPDNILLVRSTKRNRLVKLLDFGLATATVSLASEPIAGTPEYLAPERIQGGPPSVSTDIYALGILFYELLTGEPPFLGTVEEVLRHHVESDIPPPSSILSDSIDERADLIIARATARDPNDRHASVSAFIYELRAFCDMHGISTRRRSGDNGVLAKNAATEAAKAGAELFENAPIPLASVTKDGTIRVANRAFLQFLGRTTLTSELRLPQTRLLKVYPNLVQDLKSVAESGQTIKKVLSIPSGADESIHAVIILSAPPQESTSIVHLAVHPLG